MANVIEGAPIRYLERIYEADAKHIVATSADEFVTNKSAHWAVSRLDLDTLRKVAGKHAADAFDRAWLRNNKAKGANLSNHDAFLNLMLAALAGNAEKLAADLDRVRDGTADAALAEQFTRAVACTGDIACEWIELTKAAFRPKDPYYAEPQPTTTSDQIKIRAQEAVDGALERYLDGVAWLRASSSPTGETKAEVTTRVAGQAAAKVRSTSRAKTQAMYAAWQARYKVLNAANKDMTAVAIAKKIATEPIGKGKSFTTIRHKMMP